MSPEAAKSIENGPKPANRLGRIEIRPSRPNFSAWTEAYVMATC